jgi:hypothetical protein
MKQLDFSAVHPELVIRFSRYLKLYPSASVYILSSNRLLLSVYIDNVLCILYISIRVRTRVRAGARGEHKRKRATKLTPKRTSHILEVRRKLEYYTHHFAKEPSVALSRRSVSLAKKHGVWDALSLLGLYLELYKHKYGREYAGSQVGLLTLYRDIKLVHQRVGDECVDAIRVLFSDKMNWASNPLTLMVNRDGYERFIVPIMAAVKKRKQSGEQSEHTGPRDGKPSSKEVEL